jgi:hypothetical protein
VNRIRDHVGPLWPYLVLIGIPSAAFILPDLIAGHLVLTGDNLQQNYPLHVLVGSMLRHGQLPYWNQYIFSGSPLLADFNAGAFYPLTGLFVILPDRAAWIATEIILFSAVAIGMYTFLRALALSTMACLLAAATFAFSGTMLSQVNHVDMTEGFVAIPWMLLAVLHIVRDGRWRWSVLLGIAFATVILGGAPEAMLDETILIFAYAALSAGIDRVSWWRVLTRGSVGAVLALSLAAVQWWPGLNAIANSQRGLNAGFAVAGSYPPYFGFLSVVPYLLGGYGHLGENSFFSQYNLPEVGIYLGILPVMALVTMWRPRWPSRLPGRERRTWYLVGLLGLLLALGSNTPLEHLFNALPLYGHQRLQSRNMIDVSLAVCVLFAGWIDRLPESRHHQVKYDRAVALLPFGLVAGLTSWAMFGPGSLLRRVGGVSAAASFVGTARVATVTALMFCASATVVIWLRNKLPTRWWMGAVTIFVAVDLGLVALTSQLATYPLNSVLAGHTSVEQLVAARAVPGGRFDVYDPMNIASSPDTITGLPDLNILARLPSVAGYASIVNGNYSAVTQTHNLGELNVAELTSGTLDRLDLQEVLTIPEYFVVPLSGQPTTLAGAQHMTENRVVDPVVPFGNPPDFTDPFYTFYPGAQPPLHVAQSSSEFFGQSMDPASATLLFTAATASTATVRFGKLRPSGGTNWGPDVAVAPGAKLATAALPAGNAVGLALNVVSGVIPGFQAVISVNQQEFELDGSLSRALSPGLWRQAGALDGYVLYVRRKPPQPIFVVTGAGQQPPHVTVLSSTTKSEVIKVHVARASTLVRDVAWDPGWVGTVAVNGGAPRPVPVTERHLVQGLQIPPGTDVVTFRYRPPHIVAAAWLSLSASVILIGLLVAALVRRRLRRRQVGAQQ